MKYCIKCGNELNDDARFCVSCGTAVEVPAAPAAPAYQAPAAPKFEDISDDDELHF